jgi:small-conductance mechanosensitive channel
MMKKLAAEQQHAPTAWERSAAMATWLSVNITLLAVILGLLEFFLLRKRRPFLAIHGLRAAIAQALVMTFVAGLYVSTFLVYNVRDSFDYLLNGVLPQILRSPGSIAYYWSMLSPLSRTILTVMLGITPAILLVSIIGALTALFGHRQAAPREDHTPSSPAAAAQ